MVRAVILVALLPVTLLGLSPVPVAARSLLPPGRGGPLPAAAAQPDTACAAFGPGFRKIQGSDTCVRLSGSVRVEMGVNTAGSSFFPTPGR